MRVFGFFRIGKKQKKDTFNQIKDLQRCPFCKKVLFKKRNGTMSCPNECDQLNQRTAFNTVTEPFIDRREDGKTYFDPWKEVKY